MVVGIVGGGASGMAAALAASENPNVEVVLWERQSRIGRKLQATGNGRCNLTNLHATEGGYHGQEPDFARYALEKYNPEQTLAWFSKLGLVTVAEPSGRVYPYSDQANSVVDVLRFALNRENITLYTGTQVQKIRREKQGFRVETEDQSQYCDKMIIACGGLAGTKLGGSLSGYQLLGKLGHTSTRLRPALVQLKSEWAGVEALKGVRANCHVQIQKNGTVFSQSTGEIQFTQYGLSGPVIFEVSRDVCHEQGSWVAVLDFLPQWDEERLVNALASRQNTALLCEELLTGILHNRLGRVLTKAAGISLKKLVRDLTAWELNQVCQKVKGFEISLTEPMGMDMAQVTAGGIQTQDFDPKTMESRRIPGLYACGEVLDIDGDCGGYNLQWAWSSGHCAGESAGKEKA